MSITKKQEQEILNMNKSLQTILKSSSPDFIQAKDILTQLDKIPQISIDLLKSTKIAITIQSIKKLTSDNEISSLAKEIISKWKKQTTDSILNSTTVEKSFDKSPSKRKSNRVIKPVETYGEEMTKESIKVIKSQPKVTIYPAKQKIPSKNSNGELVFPDYPEFRPNMTPKEVLQAGSFGGTYFRIITSGVTGLTYKDVWKEFPEDWFEHLNISKQVTAQVYNKAINKYGDECGGDLNMWESSGWITDSDPYGWFQWYCRFYLGRRCSDDDRQISRGLGVIGAKGRWRNNLINKCISSGKSVSDALNDYKISPKVRQLLQHWGYTLTLKDLQQGLKKKSK